MALQFNRTDANTGHVYTVYARIDTSTVLVGGDAMVNINLGLYDSMSAAGGGLKPVLPSDTPAFTADETSTPNAEFVTALASAVQAGSITSPSDALKTALYVLLKQRATYSGALDV